MLSTPTVQQHEKFANVAKQKKTCHDMSVSVSVLLNFKMSQHTTFPTKLFSPGSLLLSTSNNSISSHQLPALKTELSIPSIP